MLNFTKNIDFINKIYDNLTETSMVNNEWGINHLEVPFSWLEICAANTTDLAEADMLCNGHYQMQGRKYVNIGAALETIGCGG